MPDGFGEVRRLAADLRGASAQASKLADLAVRKAAFDVEAKAKQYAPVDTGFLRNSIGTDFAPGRAVIGPTAHYGAFVEFGTARQQAQPYMTPAADAATVWLGQALANAGVDLITKGG